MAEEAIKKLEEQLNCSICLDTYTDPKLLQCFHVYCQQCLVPLVDRGQAGLTCPACRQVTPVPELGVASLPPAFHINRLIEIQNSFKKLGNSAAALEGAVGGATVNEAPSRNVGRCFEHGEEYKLYCETLICWKCPLKGFKHHDHDYDELDSAFKKYEKEITSSLDPMEGQVKIIDKTLSQLDMRCGKISDQRGATEDSIHSTFRHLREVLDVRETELISQLDEITQSKLKGLAAQKDQIETTLAQLCSCLHFMRESLKADSKVDALMMKSNTMRQIKELTTPFHPDILEPNTQANIVFSVPTNATSLCQSYGQLLCTIKVKHQLHSNAGTERIRGSPVQTLGGVKGPNGVVVNKRGELVVVEKTGYCVSVFSPSGEMLRSFHIDGSDQELVQEPYGITLDGEGNILVGVSKSYILKLSDEGAPQFLRSEIPPGRSPTGLAFNAANSKIYVTCGSSMCILNSDLTISSPFGKSGTGEGEFQSVRDVACDSTGNVYVADRDNDRIQVFTAEGRFLRMFGGRIEGERKLKWPSGITIDSNDMVYVSEWSGNRVSVFTSEGQFVTSLGKLRELRYPEKLAVDSSGVVYVCDDHKRVQMFYHTM